MLKTALALAAAIFIVASTPSAQAAPGAVALSVKSIHSVVEPVYWRRHWHGYRYWRRPVYWGHRHYWRHPVYWRHRHYYRYWGPARRRCGWWW